LAVQRSNIDHFVIQAVNNPNWDQHMAAAMYELMIPNRLKSFSRDTSDVVLVVDQESARYPWELIHDRRAGYERPMVTEIGMIRQLTTFTFREQVKDVRNRNILVVGDPKNTPDEFAPLPGAEREARLVTDTLNRHGFNVTEEICEDSGPIMTSLMSNDFRILHLAGHGVYRYQRHDRQQRDKVPKKPVAETVTDSEEHDLITGMVLGDGVFLTAVEIGQMMEVPELVFINCCHLGIIGDSAENKQKYKQTESYPRHAFAASVARELINMGVRAVVAAGWAVDDAAALTFAETFYERMLAGLPFGEAVRQARAETYELHGDRTNTWGAYQCYGDPAYVLVKGDASVSPDEEPRFVDLEEAIVEINNLSEDARTASMRGTLALRDKLEAFYADIERAQPWWLDDAALNEALGRAYGEVDLFERAVDCYKTAQRSNKATASIRSVEQWANLQGRWAVRLHEKGEDDKAVANIEASIGALRKLNELFGKSSERLSLLGSACKRLAQISIGPERDAALAEMFTYYDSAWQKTPKDPYPLINALVAQIIRYWLGGVAQRDAELKGKFDTALKLATQRKEEHPNDFWAAVGLADAELAHHLLQEDLKKHQVNLLKHYKDAWKHFGSPRELRSVIEHLEFIMMVLKSDHREAAHDSKERESMRRELGEALNFIWSELVPLVEQ
jgi:tetratricopeptide (TPR) repeat protein